MRGNIGKTVENWFVGNSSCSDCPVLNIYAVFPVSTFFVELG